MTELTPRIEPAQPSSDFVVPEGIQRARAAFMRDFATLIANRRTRGKFVLYHNDALAAVAKEYVAIVRAAVAKNSPVYASLIVKVVPAAEAEEWAFLEESELP